MDIRYLRKWHANNRLIARFPCKGIWRLNSASAACRNTLRCFQLAWALKHPNMKKFNPLAFKCQCRKHNHTRKVYAQKIHVLDFVHWLPQYNQSEFVWYILASYRVRAVQGVQGLLHRACTWKKCRAPNNEKGPIFHQIVRIEPDK